MFSPGCSTLVFFGCAEAKKTSVGTGFQPCNSLKSCERSTYWPLLASRIIRSQNLEEMMFCLSIYFRLCTEIMEVRIVETTTSKTHCRVGSGEWFSKWVFSRIVCRWIGSIGPTGPTSESSGHVGEGLLKYHMKKPPNHKQEHVQQPSV